MPAVDLATLPRVAIRPLIVAVAHVPILIIVLLVMPVWVMAVVRPDTNGVLALKLLKELRNWSRDVISSTNGRGSR